MDLSFPKHTNQMVKKPTTALHEYCSLGNFQRPVVELYFNDDIFICRITVVELNLSGYGSGERRVGAQEQAADELLRKLKAPVLLGVEPRPRVDGGLIELLNGLCQIADLPLPDYEVHSDEEDDRVFVAMCQVRLDKSYGTGLSENDAMQIAAKDMLDSIIDRQGLIESENRGMYNQELLQKFKIARVWQRMDTAFYKGRQKFQKKYGDMKGEQYNL